MFDLIQFVDSVDNISDAHLRRRVDAHVAALRASPSGVERRCVREAEQPVQSHPEHAFSFVKTGAATLTAAGQAWYAGRFETPSIRELRARCTASAAGAAGSGRVKLWVLDGASSAT